MESTLRGLAGRVALVTGAGSGIGAAVVRHLVGEGVRVVCVDVVAAGLEVLRDELGSAVLPVVADVADERSDAVARAVEWGGRLDIAYLNAGVEGPLGPLHLTPVAEFDRVMRVNVRGVWLGLTALLPVMREQRSGVITIASSTGGLRGSGGLAAYSASKHAVVGLTRTAAIENGPLGIRVNALHPGPTRTPMLEAIMRGKALDAGPGSGPPQLGRLGEPREIAAAVAFLSSDDASFITGASLVVDGGLLAGAPFRTDDEV